MNTNSSLPSGNSSAMPAVQNSQTKEWKGLTIDELKMRRAKALVFREVNRANLSYQFNNARDNFSQNGVRSLLFSNNTIAGLMKADYMFIGVKAISLLIKLYLRRKK